MQPARVKFMGASGWYTAKHFFPSLMCGRMSTSQGRRLHRRLSCSGQQRLLTLEIRVETPKPQVVEQGLQGLV